MKKKIALLLASAMTLSSLVPMNLFASTLAIGSGGTTSYKENDVTTSHLNADPDEPLTGEKLIDGTGKRLRIMLDSNESPIPPERSFAIRIDNAKFNYVKSSSSIGKFDDGTDMYDTFNEEWFVDSLGSPSPGRKLNSFNSNIGYEFETGGYSLPTSIATETATLRVIATVNQVKTQFGTNPTGATIVGDMRTIPSSAITNGSLYANGSGGGYTTLTSFIDPATPLTAPYANIGALQTAVKNDLMLYFTDHYSTTGGTVPTASFTDLVASNYDFDGTGITSVNYNFAPIAYLIEGVVDAYVGTLALTTNVTTDMIPGINNLITTINGMLTAYDEHQLVNFVEIGTTELLSANFEAYRVLVDKITARNAYRGNPTLDITGANPDGVDYKMEIVGENIAIITYKASTGGSAFYVPMALKASNNNPIVANIVNDGTGSSSIAQTQSTIVTNTTASLVTASIGETYSGFYELPLDTIKVTEVFSNALQGNNITIYLSIPNDNDAMKNMQFSTGLNASNVTLSGDNLLSVNSVSSVELWRDANGNVDPRILAITFTATSQPLIRGTLNISGIKITPIYASNSDAVGNINLAFSSPQVNFGSGTSTVTNPRQNAVSVHVATRALTGTTFTRVESESEVPTIKAGRVEQAASRVVVSEKVPNSWWTKRSTQFILTDAEGNRLTESQVKITKIQMETTNVIAPNYVDNTSDTKSRWNGNDFFNFIYADAGDTAPNTYSNVSWERNGTGVTVLDLNPQLTSAGGLKPVTLQVQFWLSAAADFTGDVFIMLVGYNDMLGLDIGYNQAGSQYFDYVSFPDFVQHPNPVRIATVRPTAEVMVDRQTSVQIGYQSTYQIEKIVIAETQRGDWNADDAYIYVGEYQNGYPSSYLYFGSPSRDSVSLNNTATRMTISNFIAGSRIRPLSFRIDRKSDNISASLHTQVDPAVITIESLVINSDRTIPYGTYDVIFGGPAIVDNYFDMDAAGNNTTFTGDRFQVAGYYTSIINVTTPGSTKATSKEIVIEEGSTVYVDGVAVELEDETGSGEIYLDPETGSFMVPIRFISVVLDMGVLWDEEDRTVTVSSTSGDVRNIVKFTDGSSIASVNGVDFPLVNQLGERVVSFINPDYDRFYLPFRALGNALGLEVAYDDVNHQGIYNPVMTDTVAE